MEQLNFTPVRRGRSRATRQRSVARPEDHRTYRKRAARHARGLRRSRARLRRKQAIEQVGANHGTAREALVAQSSVPDRPTLRRWTSPGTPSGNPSRSWW